jgi:hypothetical protein
MRWIEIHLGVRGFRDWEHLAIRRMAGTGQRGAHPARGQCIFPARASALRGYRPTLSKSKGNAATSAKARRNPQGISQKYFVI